ncbi:hypothetical protein AC578_7214 [Pseudocercospora eumusae]|uniref:Uncharacterized protein n=1 Tax=Pseudocercospora eumusae TaxID=321146 RepID=A0A139HWL6_9PEZI|nr:hypothetical protein AC578_7214 [Pseudocercospora eumusae]
MSDYDPYTSISDRDRNHAARVDDAQIMMPPPLPKQRIRRSERSQSEEVAEGPIPASAQNGHIPSSQAFYVGHETSMRLLAIQVHWLITSLIDSRFWLSLHEEEVIANPTGYLGHIQNTKQVL